jgi:hypothetical protein
MGIDGRDPAHMKTNFLLCGLACALSVATVATAADREVSGVTRSPSAAGDGVAVGIAKRDGVTVSGNEAFVTRNGVTEKLAKELRLPSGILVRPDGSVMLTNHAETTLQADQLLTFDGHILAIPNDPNVNPALPPATTQALVTENSVTVRGTANSNRSTSVFLSSSGAPFMGTVTSPGVITTVDGTTIPIDGSIRAVSFGPGDVSFVGRLNANGTIAGTNGTTIFPDGSVRDARGNLLSPAATGRGAAVSPTMQNTANPGTTSQFGSTTGTATQQGVTNQQGTTTQQGVTNQQGTSTQQGVTNQQGTTTQQPATNQQGAVTSPQGVTNQTGTGTAGQFRQPANTTQGQFVSPTNGSQGQFTTQPAPSSQTGNAASRNFGNTPATNGNAGGATGAGGGAPAGGAGR